MKAQEIKKGTKVLIPVWCPLKGDFADYENAAIGIVKGFDNDGKVRFFYTDLADYEEGSMTANKLKKL